MKDTIDFSQTKLITDKLNKNRVDLSGQDSLNVLEMDPWRLIDHRRFDIVAKYIYAWFREKDLKSNWGKEIYDNHLWVFNQYDEDDGSGKKGIDAFINSFDVTLKSFKENGFNDGISLIPISKNNTPLDGAHRLTAALLYNQKVKVARLEQGDVNYNYEFFKNRGLLPKWCDAIAYEYCKLKRSTYIVTVFPNSLYGREGVKELLKKYGNIFYEKEVILNKKGISNLLSQHCIGKELVGHHQEEYMESNILHVFIFENKNDIGYRRLMKEIQSDVGISVTDSKEETIRHAQVFLNQNTIHFLNYACPIRNQLFKTAFEQYKDILNEQNESDNFCLVSDSVKNIYGVRSSDELAYIYRETQNFDIKDNLLENGFHKSLNLTYKKSIDDIIFNPENHFYYQGMKVASLKIKKQIKKDRKNYVDWLVVKVIENIADLFYSFDIEFVKYNIIKKCKILRLKFGTFRMKILQAIKRW
ncbi:hypothetical protein [Cytobacillus firmus]|uniref:hypothetical protein n=1 Tax=Cytobacillus firmus TaxID=1399 RepID=UPI001CFDC43E|nr:hypothetical protein [Cytobacillus firmus]